MKTLPDGQCDPKAVPCSWISDLRRHPRSPIKNGPCNIHDGGHLAGDTCVVNRHNGFGARNDGSLDLAFVDVQGVGANIEKTGMAPRKIKASAVDTKV